MVSADAEYQSLIRPARYWTHWSFDAQDMHEISRDHLLADGLDPGRVVAELNKLFKGARLCSDSPQDVFWLDTLYEAAVWSPRFSYCRWRALSDVSSPIRSIERSRRGASIELCQTLENSCRLPLRTLTSKGWLTGC